MSLKENLKSFKLNESGISMVIGVVVIIVVGILVIRYFSNTNDNSTLPPISTEEESMEGTITVDEEGRKVYVVASGDTLWLIAQKQYGSGLKWAQIAAANNLENPGDIENGQELIIPDDESEETDESMAMENTEEEEPLIDVEVTVEEAEDEPEPEMTEEVVPTMEAVSQENDQVSEPSTNNDQESISSDKYIVVRGDNLWTIAERAYGDGTKWVMIAEENDLANPDIIHAGNEFSLPR